MDFTPTGPGCFANLGSCENGQTVCIDMSFDSFEENAMYFTSGADTEDGIGFSVYYRFGSVNVIGKTATRDYSIELATLQVQVEYKFCMSLTTDDGLQVVIDGQPMGSDKTGLEKEIEANVTEFKKIICARPTERETHFNFGELTLGGLDVFYNGLNELVEDNVITPRKLDYIPFNSLPKS